MDTGHITALVTGANRGLGKHFAAQLVGRGAKVYAAARRPETIELSGVEPLQLDITDPTSVRRAADLAGDVTVLINNAGTATRRVSAVRGVRGRPAGDGDALLRHPERHPGFRAGHRRQRRRSDPQHAVGVVLAA